MLIQLARLLLQQKIQHVMYWNTLYVFVPFDGSNNNFSPCLYTPHFPTLFDLAMAANSNTTFDNDLLWTGLRRTSGRLHFFFNGPHAHFNGYKCYRDCMHIHTIANIRYSCFLWICRNTRPIIVLTDVSILHFIKNL